MKAISTVIATILMLMIVVGLGGTAYLFISGTFTGKISTAFELIDSVNDTVIIRNSGTEPINKISATLDGSPVNTIFDLNNDLVGYWRMNEGTETTTKDDSGKGNTGTLANGPIWVDGKFGKALQFDGGDDVISLTSSPSSLISNAMTISLWVKPSVDWDTAAGGHWYFIYTAGSSQGFYLKANDGTGDLDFTTGDSTFASAIITTDWDANRWYHLVIVYDGSNAIFYRDGTQIGTSLNVRPSIGDSSSVGTISEPSNAMAGILDEFKIYSKTLTPKDIDALYILGGETVLDPGQIITIKPIATISKGTHTLRLCTSSICNTAILTIQ